MTLVTHTYLSGENGFATFRSTANGIRTSTITAGVLSVDVVPGPVYARVVLRSPSAKGIILDRRLAPNAALFAEVDQARRADHCEPIKG